jgi:PPP family 3-phenylpropionic acid transporter
MPLLPIYLSQLGVSASAITLLLAINAAVGLLVAQYAGYIADVWTRRTTLLLWMSLFAALCSALFPRIPANLLAIAVGLGALSVFTSQRVQIYNSIMLDSHGGEQMFGRIRVVGSLGFAIVTVLVGWLADMPRFTIAIMWPVLVLIELLFALSVILLKDEPPARRLAVHSSQMSFLTAQKLLLGNRLIMSFLLYVFFCQFAQIPLHLLQIKLLENLGASAAFSTGSLATAAVAEMLIFYCSRQIMRRFRLMGLMAIVPLAVFVRFGLVCLFPNPWVIFATNVLHMITFGLNYLCCVLFINRESPPELKASAQTLLALAFSFLATLVGNLFSSGILEWLTVGYGLTETAALRALFGIGAVVTLFSFVVFMPMKREYDRKHAGMSP